MTGSFRLKRKRGLKGSGNHNGYPLRLVDHHPGQALSQVIAGVEMENPPMQQQLPQLDNMLAVFSLGRC
ncbi:MAG: hypothetical protein JAY85_05210 [Candidatus Thiodiazotropha weberae]|uniref:hypothetical protein n=1 Tax=Candidatus Thiodiazotropha endoloripes TaxID=1818881 RepID=UPI00114CC316|nr:hypothetical protein [Candidatus Thiodiazotropha endoloripes]MCG7897842.1 hypothetical protein [Candidatus Thiodiazotropha weberae]